MMLCNCVKKCIAYLLVLAMTFGCFFGAETKYAGAAAKAKLAKKKVNIYIGKKHTIKIKDKKAKCTYTFSTNKKKIATVSKKGVVVGKRKGTAKITVKEKNKKNKKTRKLGVVTVVVKKKVADNNNLTDETPTPTVSANNNGTADNVTTVATPTPTPLYLSYDFSDGNISDFVAQGEGVRIELAPTGYDDENCLKASNRINRNGWFGCGMGYNAAKSLQAGKIYDVSCYVKSNNSGTDTITLRSIVPNNGGGFSFPTQVGESVKVKGGEWTKIDVIFATPDSIKNGLVLYWDAESTSDMFLDNLEIRESKGLDSTFKDTFSEIFGYVGACNTYSQMRDNKTFTTSLYNSVTMENETKPNTFLTGSNFGGGANISDTLPDGYILPDSYRDSTYPVLNFKTFDDVISTAYEYGFKVRFHVLVWHSQTPEFFFRNNYDENRGYVSPEVMDGRMEYYIQNVIHHIYNTPHGKDVVYCIDVVNEYFHNYDQGNKSPWNAVYYPEEKTESDRTDTPEYVKKAFEITYDALGEFDLQGKVKLFYNDYNTYEVCNRIITLINYVNSDRKICDGVGMQSHLDVKYPTPGPDGKIAMTIDDFAREGFEIQITELDVTDYNNSGMQAQYYYDLMHMLVSKKKAGVNITGVTFWGLCDTNSWRRDGKPLLFSALFCPKDSYYKVLDAAKAAWAQ